MPTYTDAAETYLKERFGLEDNALREIRKAAVTAGLPPISVAPEEGQFLQVLVRATGARKILEIGTLGGYSAAWMVRGMPDDGRLITIEKSPEHAEVAQQALAAVGLAERIELRVGNAHDLLPTLSADGPFDLLFMDADKQGYPDYFAWGLDNVRVGGLIAAHNAFRHGRVLHEQPDVDSQAIRELTDRIAAEPRVTGTISAAGDGTLLAVVNA